MQPENVEGQRDRGRLRSAPLVRGPSKRSENIPYLLGVDHLRGVAALLIVYYHGIQLFSVHSRYHTVFAPLNWLTAPDPFSALILEGHTAVALFMVLSGFIFAFGAAGKRIAYGQFLANRFFRTYPLFLFVVVVGTAVHYQGISLLPLVQTLLGGANLAGAQQLGSLSLMFWSLAVEWQFYLIFPALMTFANHKGLAQLGLLCGLVLAARGLGYFQGAAPVESNYTQLLGRLDQFIVGMVAGIVYQRAPSHPAFRWALIPAVSFLFCGAYAFNQFGGWPRQHWLKLLTPTLEGLIWSAVIVSYVAVAERRASRQGPLSRLMVAIGATSYSIYLWHFAFIELQRTNDWVPRLVAQHELNAALVVTLTTLPVLLLFSALSYHAIEKPFLALRKRYIAPERIVPTSTETATSAGLRGPAALAGPEPPGEQLSPAAIHSNPVSP